MTAKLLKLSNKCSVYKFITIKEFLFLHYTIFFRKYFDVPHLTLLTFNTYIYSFVNKKFLSELIFKNGYIAKSVSLIQKFKEEM